jgi:hypothetical protein
MPEIPGTHDGLCSTKLTLILTQLTTRIVVTSGLSMALRSGVVKAARRLCCLAELWRPGFIGIGSSKFFLAGQFDCSDQ